MNSQHFFHGKLGCFIIPNIIKRLRTFDQLCGFIVEFLINEYEVVENNKKKYY